MPKIVGKPEDVPNPTAIHHRKLKFFPHSLSPNSLVVEKVELKLKGPKLQARPSLNKLLKETKKIQDEAANGINTFKQNVRKAKKKDTKKAFGLKDVYNTTGDTVSRAEVEKVKDIVILHEKRMDLMTSAFKEQLLKQKEYIDELLKTVNTISNDYVKVINATKSLARLNVIRPVPLPDEDLRHKCFFCESTKHAGWYCLSYPSAIARRAELDREKKCYVCFRSHPDEECGQVKIRYCTNCPEHKRHRKEICLVHATEEKIKEKIRRHEEQKKEMEKGGEA